MLTRKLKVKPILISDLVIDLTIVGVTLNEKKMIIIFLALFPFFNTDKATLFPHQNLGVKGAEMNFGVPIAVGGKTKEFSAKIEVQMHMFWHIMVFCC